MSLQLMRRLVRDHHIKALWAIVVALLIGNISGFVGGFTVHDTIVRALGGAKDSQKVIQAHWISVTPAMERSVGGGGGAVDLSYLFGPVLAQSGNECGSFSLTALLYALRVGRGEAPATYFSPWFHRYNTVGLANVYTTMDQNIIAAARGGMVYHWRQEGPGMPSVAEYAAAAARSASYAVFSEGGAGTFDQIAYEVRTGHPVWWLHNVYQTEWYLPSSGYTDNAGPAYGSHYEVAVGVYGDYLKIRGSWGTRYGLDGYYYVSRSGVDRTTIEASIVSIGRQVVWPKPAPKAAPTVRPTVRPTTRPTAKPTTRPTTRPTARPTARPTTRPTPHGRLYIVVHGQYLRSKPLTSAITRVFERTKANLTYLNRFTTHWILVRDPARHQGWILKSNVK